MQTGWVATWNACKNKTTATAAQRAAKNSAKKSYIAKLRLFIQAQIQYNATMTDAQRIQCGITPHSNHRTPMPVPDSIPQIEILPNAGHALKINFRQQADAAGTSKRGKPIGVDSCKVVYLVSPTAITPTPSQCITVVDATRSPLKITFDVSAAGKFFYCYACWQNAKNEAGDWSELHSASIP